MKLFKREQAFEIAKRLIELLNEKAYKTEAELQLEYYKTKEPVPYAERLKGDYKKITKGEVWGELWDCAWFRISAAIPATAAKTLALAIDFSGELCIYDDGGVPIRGLTSHGSFDPMLGSPVKKHFRIQNKKAGDTVEFYIDAGCNDLFGNLERGEIKEAAVVSVREDVRELYYDVVMLYKLANRLSVDSARRASICYALLSINNELAQFSESEIAAAKKIADRELKKVGGTASLEMSAIGHSHLDLAWLWPIRETKRKAVRTLATALEYIERYPDYIYCISQPQQLEWVKEISLPLYEKILKQIQKGRIEPVGAMWVEPDLNVTGGESLVRQIMLGQRFWQEECGITVDNCWLPDVFGFNGQLPQILAKSGIKHLCTIKLSWNRYNKFPFHSFQWRGIDGTEVLTHMPPEGTYNSEASPDSIVQAEKNYVEKGISANALLLYGIGDGGGGPGASHLEFLKREKNIDGLCPVVSRTAKEFFTLLDAEKDGLPTYKGEMYLEKHQGTYTTQANNKKYNRKMESLLHTAEFLSAALNRDTDLQEIWKEVLLYQFHDILPGSSIKRVYTESVARYELLMNEMQSRISALLNGAPYQEKSLLNSTSYVRKETVYVDGAFVQAVVEPYSSCPVSVCKPIKTGATAGEKYFENELIRVELKGDGAIAAVTDRQRGRQYVAKANELKLFYDDGDCWDLNDSYREKPYDTLKATRSKVFCDGVKAGVVNEYRFGNSEIVQTVSLTVGERFVRFDTQVNWCEDHRMLRAEFDTLVKSDETVYDIQFGKVKRTAAVYNSLDFARDEVCAQHYADYSQNDFGVALINDSKFGYRVKDGAMSINLLRSQTNPGKDADIGKHEFTYLLYVHEEKSEADKIAYSLNYPLIPVSARIASFVSVDNENMIIETVKKCESGDGVIVRLYESLGKFGTATLKTDFKKYVATAMTEEAIGEETDILVPLTFTPFEIKTVKLYGKL